MKKKKETRVYHYRKVFTHDSFGTRGFKNYMPTQDMEYYPC